MSRRKKRPLVVVEKDYAFPTNKGVVTISATTLYYAKQIFQIQFGYWPEQELNYGNAHPKAPASQESSDPRPGD